jgi:predicted O-methyltransferase YrrM
MTGDAYSIPEVKALLRVLAAGKCVAETGTSWGDGAAAMAEVAAHVTTVEHDPKRLAVAREKLAPLPNVELLEGDWRDVLSGTYELLFFDAGNIDARVVELLGPGGLLVKDDMTPGRPIQGDPVRELLFGHPELVATEFPLTGEMSVILAARRAHRPSGR